MDLEENNRGIGHFQSYMNTPMTTHLLKLKIDWEENGRGISHFSVRQVHTKHNSPTEDDEWIVRKRGRGIGHFQTYMNTQNTTH